MLDEIEGTVLWFSSWEMHVCTTCRGAGPRNKEVDAAMADAHPRAQAPAPCGIVHPSLARRGPVLAFQRPTRDGSEPPSRVTRQPTTLCVEHVHVFGINSND